MSKIMSTVMLLDIILFAQTQIIGKIGINTSNPEKELMVDGTMKTSGTTLKDPIENL